MPYVYAMDFIDVLNKKHASRGYKKMVRCHFSCKILLEMMLVYVKSWRCFFFIGYICGSL